MSIVKSVQLLLIRHAEPNNARSGNGLPVDPPLTEGGRRQAERLLRLPARAGPLDPCEQRAVVELPEGRDDTWVDYKHDYRAPLLDKAEGIKNVLTFG